MSFQQNYGDSFQSQTSIDGQNGVSIPQGVVDGQKLQTMQQGDSITGQFPLSAGIDPGQASNSDDGPKSTLWYVYIYVTDRYHIYSIPISNGNNRMGELEPWMDENYVRTVWYNMNFQVNVKMIRDKFNG